MKVGRSAPMTRAQEFQWYFQRSKLVRFWRLDATHTHASVSRVVQSLVEDLETLRTVFDYADGELCQVVREPSAPCLTPVHWPAHEQPPTTEALEVQLTIDREASVGTTRVQFALAEDNSVPTWLVMEVDHAILDGASAAVVDRHVQRLLRGDPPAGYPDPMPRRHPRQLADYEASPAGQRERSRANRYLAAQLARGPLVNYPAKDRQNTAHIELRTWVVGGREVLRAAASRLRTDPSSLIFGVFGFILSVDSGNESPHINVWVANRFTEFRRSVVGAIAQGVPITVRPGGARTCFDYVSAATDALLPGYRHATYSPRDLMAIATELGTDPWACDAGLNFVGAGPGGVLGESLSAKPEWPPRIIDREPGFPYSVRYQLALFGSDVLATVVMDAKLFTVSRAQRFFAAFEYALRRAASGKDTTKSELQREFSTGRTCTATETVETAGGSAPV